MFFSSSWYLWCIQPPENNKGILLNGEDSINVLYSLIMAVTRDCVNSNIIIDDVCLQLPVSTQQYESLKRHITIIRDKVICFLSRIAVQYLAVN